MKQIHGLRAAKVYALDIAWEPGKVSREPSQDWEVWHKPIAPCEYFNWDEIESIGATHWSCEKDGFFYPIERLQRKPNPHSGDEAYMIMSRDFDDKKVKGHAYFLAKRKSL